MRQSSMVLGFVGLVMCLVSCLLHRPNSFLLPGVVDLDDTVDICEETTDCFLPPAEDVGLGRVDRWPAPAGATLGLPLIRLEAQTAPAPAPSLESSPLPWFRKLRNWLSPMNPELLWSLLAFCFSRLRNCTTMLTDSGSLTSRRRCTIDSWSLLMKSFSSFTLLRRRSSTCN